MHESEHLNDFIDYQVKMLGKFKELCMSMYHSGDAEDYYVLWLERGTWSEECAVCRDIEEAKR